MGIIFSTERFEPDTHGEKVPHEEWPDLIRNAADVVRMIVGDGLWNAELVK